MRLRALPLILTLATALPALATAPLPPLDGPAAPGVERVWGSDVGAGVQVAQALQEARAFCDALPDDSYTIDCLADRIGDVAARMSPRGPYAGARKTLLATSARLTAVADKYWDRPRGQRAFATQGGGQRTARAIRPIAPQNRAPAKAAAEAVVAEAETVLLRSIPASPQVAPQLELIAAAVGSNKVLIRST